MLPWIISLILLQIPAAKSLQIERDKEQNMFNESDTEYIIIPLSWMGHRTKQFSTVCKGLIQVKIMTVWADNIDHIETYLKQRPTYFDCAEKQADAKMAASTSTLSWESRLWWTLWWAFFLSGMIVAKLPSILHNFCFLNLKNRTKHRELEIM